MGHYTTFYFRAKLNFDLAEKIRLVLRSQFQGSEQGRAMHAALLRSEHGASAAVGAGNHTQWGGYFQNIDWIGRPSHPFFDLPRADMIPWGRQGEHFPAPLFIEYPDGSSRLEFTCEFKNYDDEIHAFLLWIMPYVRLKFGRRSRGRKKHWVGWYRSESFRGKVHVFYRPEPQLSDPWHRELDEQWDGRFD